MVHPSIACIGIIGKHVPLLLVPASVLPHNSTNTASAGQPPSISPSFPLTQPTPSAYLEFSFLLNASLDIFDARSRDRNRVDQDLGMLQAVDERLSIWGWETGTGTRFAIVIDAWGKTGEGGSQSPVSGGGSRKAVGDGDVKGAFKALQTAYIRLLQNPFYTPDEHTPTAVAAGKGKGGEIRSRGFIREVKRIGDVWKPGASV